MFLKAGRLAVAGSRIMAAHWVIRGIKLLHLLFYSAT
jgi:hypothetical protein